MKLNQLVAAIHSVHDATRAQAVQSVNVTLTIRNWLTGHYIVEFEQSGEDRAKYGDRLLETLSRKLQDDGMKGMSPTALKLFREFYRGYPQIRQTLSDQFASLHLKSFPALPSPKNKTSIRQTASDQFSVEPRLLLNRLSFSHFVEL